MKLPEPYMTVYSKTRNNLSGETLPLYTEAQYKQGQRDALEAAAKVCDARHHATTDGAAVVIRKLMEGL